MEINPNEELRRLENQKNVITQPRTKKTIKQKKEKSQNADNISNLSIPDESNIIKTVEPVEPVNNEEEEEDDNLDDFIKQTMTRNDEMIELKNTIKSLHESIASLNINNAPKPKQKKHITSDKHKEALAKGRQRLAFLREEKKQALLESKKEIKQKYSGKHNLINKSNNKKIETEKKEEKPIFRKENKTTILVFD